MWFFYLEKVFIKGLRFFWESLFRIEVREGRFLEVIFCFGSFLGKEIGWFRGGLCLSLFRVRFVGCWNIFLVGREMGICSGLSREVVEGDFVWRILGSVVLGIRCRIVVLGRFYCV